jgi:hypothetical protein
MLAEEPEQGYGYPHMVPEQLGVRPLRQVGSKVRMPVPGPAASPLPLAAPFGFSNRQGSEDHCQACAPESSVSGWCNLYRPVYYCPADRSWMSPQTVQTENCSQTSWTVGPAPILGARFSAVYRSFGCCADRSDIAVFDGARRVGTVRSYTELCNCGEFTSTEVIDTFGRSRFTRRINPCGYPGTGTSTVSMDCCGYTERGMLLFGPAGTPTVPVGMMHNRYHTCCYACYPRWYGFRNWPTGTMTTDDQLLLIAMLHRFEYDIRRTREQKRSNTMH